MRNTGAFQLGACSGASQCGVQPRWSAARFPRMAALQLLQPLNKSSARVATFAVRPCGGSRGTTYTSNKDQRVVTAHKFEAWVVVNNPSIRMFNEVLPLAQHTCSFAPRLFWNAREGVALGALASSGTTSRLLHQEEHSLAVLVLAGVDFLFVGSKVCVVHESGVLAQVTHNRRPVIMGSSEKDRI